MRPLSSASSRAASSCTGPRAVVMKMAPRFMRAKAAWTDPGAISSQPRPMSPRWPSATVTSLAATAVSPGTATLNRSANPNSAATTVWFRYSATDPGTCNDSFGTRAPIT